MMKRTLCLLLMALAPLTASAEAAKAPVVVIPASDTRIQYIGRFDVSKPDAPRFAWSGSSITARYQAEKVTLLLKDDPPADLTDDSGASFRNWFDVLIDGQVILTIVAKPDRTRYEIPCPSGNGPSHVSIFKRTEAVVGIATFLGFELSGGGKLLDPLGKPGRALEQADFRQLRQRRLEAASKLCKISPPSFDTVFDSIIG